MKFSEKYRSLYFQRKFSLLVFLNFHKSLNKEINWNALRFIILCIKTPLKMQSNNESRHLPHLHPINDSIKETEREPKVNEKKKVNLVEKCKEG